MPRYIDADALYDKIEPFYKISKGTVRDNYRFVINLICDAETADVQEVRHGHWIFLEQRPLVDFIKCSICDHITRDYWADVTGGTIKMKSKRPNYCQYCGAKMGEDGSYEKN